MSYNIYDKNTDTLIKVAGATMSQVDSALSDTSTNPVQNKVIKEELDKKANSTDVPTNTNQLTNGAGFITASGSCDKAQYLKSFSSAGATHGNSHLLYAKHNVYSDNRFYLGINSNYETLVDCARQVSGLSMSISGSSGYFNISAPNARGIFLSGDISGDASTVGGYGQSSFAKLASANTLSATNLFSKQYIPAAGTYTSASIVINPPNSAAQSTAGYAGTIGFHLPGVTAGQFYLAKDGALHYKNNGGIEYVIAMTASGSSKYVKENIKDITEEEAKKILELRPVGFDFTEGFQIDPEVKKHRHGLIAEEVQEIIPDVVQVPKYYEEGDIPDRPLTNEILSIHYEDFIPYLIKMVQIQQNEINELKDETKELKNEVEELKGMIKDMMKEK